MELEQPFEEATQQSLSTRNAFEIMKMAQKQLQFGDNGVPKTIHVSNNKDKLFNALIQLMKDIEVKWNEPSVFGVPFLKKLTDVLWYIDGHHDTIAEHAPPIPMATIVRRSTSTENAQEKMCDMQICIPIP